jgi:hypothetical protein
MAAVSSNTGSTVAQYGLSQLRLQQTRRAAQQAEQTADNLQAQARAARQDAQQADDRARSLEADSAKARLTAANAQQSLSLLQVSGQNQVTLERVSTKMVVQQSGKPATTSSPAPVVNAQGQVTGRVVNTTA